MPNILGITICINHNFFPANALLLVVLMEPEAIFRRGTLAPPSGGILNHFLHNPRLLHHRNYSPFERRFVPSSDCNKAARTPATDGKFNKTSNIFSGFSFLFHPFHTKVHISFITTKRWSFPSVTIYILRIHLQVETG